MWCPGLDSNQQSTDYESSALTVMLPGRYKYNHTTIIVLTPEFTLLRYINSQHIYISLFINTEVRNINK